MGLLDVVGMFNTAPGESGMLDQIKAAGESFNRISADVDFIKAQNKMVLDKLDYLIKVIDDLDQEENQ